MKPKGPAPTFEEGQAILTPLTDRLVAHRRDYFMAVEYDEGMRVVGALGLARGLELICHLADILQIPDEIIVAALKLNATERRAATEENTDILFDGTRWNL